MRAFAPVGKIHFETEESFVLADPEESNVNCHSAGRGKSLIWTWILIFNTAVSWGEGEAICYLFSMCNVCGGGKANTIAQRNEASHLQLFQGLPQYRLLRGVIFLLTHEYTVPFLL